MQAALRVVGTSRLGRAVIASGLALGAAAMLAVAPVGNAVADDGQPAMSVSPNWSGYVVTGTNDNPVTYSSVSGTWTVPSATCAGRDAGSLSTVWIGLGGWTTKRQEEIGTDSNCGPAGKPVYYAWFELVPYIAYPIKNPIKAGDTMSGLVKSLNPTLVELQIQDQTAGWTWTRNITFIQQDLSTAEWIAEAPASCLRFVCKEANLANFGSVTMTQISAVGNGNEGNLSSSSWNVIPIQLVPSKLTVPTTNPEATSNAQGVASSPAGSTPGPSSDDGKSFTMKWVPVATRGV